MRNEYLIFFVVTFMLIINSYLIFYPATSVDFLSGVPKLLIYQQIC